MEKLGHVVDIQSNCVEVEEKYLPQQQDRLCKSIGASLIGVVFRNIMYQITDPSLGQKCFVNT